MLHWLDRGSRGQACGDRDVDGGQDHHAGDVHTDDELTFHGKVDIVGGLVDDVHEDGWEIGNHENTPNISSKDDVYSQEIILQFCDCFWSCLNFILTIILRNNV